MKSLRILLIPFSFLYGLGVTLRNRLFDIGILRTTRLTAPVISIGNLSAGGTGKTPFVGLVVGKLRKMGRKPAVLSRGYGRRTHGYLLVSGKGIEIAAPFDGGDEAVELAHRLRDTTIVVDENRVEGARRILAESDADCIVLDDGFQHRYLHRDLDVVLMTAAELQKESWLLPAGNWRESVGSLRRANVVVISKCRDKNDFENAARKLEESGGKEMVGLSLVPKALRSVLTGKCVDRNSVQNVRVITFSGIGDPESFRRTVTDFGCEVVKNIRYSDHHWYSAGDLKDLNEEFLRQSVVMTVTTEKDFIRLRSLGTQLEKISREINLHVLEAAPEFIAGEEVFDKMLTGILK